CCVLLHTHPTAAFTRCSLFPLTSRTMSTSTYLIPAGCG
ncbi:hypothetical protein AB1N83_004682, partial [Pleurotus pulmonarius]